MIFSTPTVIKPLAYIVFLAARTTEWSLCKRLIIMCSAFILMCWIVWQTCDNVLLFSSRCESHSLAESFTRECNVRAC